MWAGQKCGEPKMLPCREGSQRTCLFERALWLFPCRCLCWPQWSPLPSREVAHLFYKLHQQRISYSQGRKKFMYYPSQSQTEIHKFHPASRRDLFKLLSGAPKQLIFRGHHFPTGQGSLLLISSSWKVACPEAANDHLGKQNKCSWARTNGDFPC